MWLFGLTVTMLGGVMVRTLNLRSKGYQFDSQLVTIISLLLGWVTACRKVNHLGI